VLERADLVVCICKIPTPCNLNIKKIVNLACKISGISTL